MQSKRRQRPANQVAYERLKKKVRRRLPDGTVRQTTLQPKRNLLVVDVGEDLWGIKRRLEEKAQQEGRTVSSIVRDILRHTLIEW